MSDVIISRRGSGRSGSSNGTMITEYILVDTKVSPNPEFTEGYIPDAILHMIGKSMMN